ncbi:hypothetical protein BFJ70_g10787 [Fusarium oxysporum]|uniref:Uncharacterized protein n=1 Tax=Fusarium oxysporum Fo47 TaxID=660027 RepID=W9L242_FUSOX|nr:hypothetical protein FOZG_00068 [Fusarium oxysporum Fo47]RKL29075.1 hypothetical protein BFJ70_g10787 [Fusarium oxysporum]
MGGIVNGAADAVGEMAQQLRSVSTAAGGTIYKLVSDSNQSLAIACGILHRADKKARNEFMSKVTKRFLEVVGQPEATTIKPSLL